MMLKVRGWLLCFVWLLGCAAGVHAQDTRLVSPEPETAEALTDPAVRPSLVADAAEESGAETEEQLWLGPSVELGYSRFWLGDGNGGGLVHAAEFGGFIPLPWIRLGARAELGVRDYTLGSDDLVARATVSVGYQENQRLGRFVPYIAGVATYGLVLGTRFTRRYLGRFEVWVWIVGLRLVKTVSVVDHLHQGNNGRTGV